MLPTADAANYADQGAWHKAWAEMRHRYAAELLGLIIVVIAAFVDSRAARTGVSVWFALALLALVVLQGMLGMLTVTWLLKPLIVTLHLLGGLTTFAMLLWLWLSMRARDRPVDGASVLNGNRLIETGGRARLWGRDWHSRLSPCRCSSGAGPAATTRPWPARMCRAARRNGFRRPTTATPSCCGAAWGINYAGGVLDHPARVAIHFTHRVGALLTSILMLLAAQAALRGLGRGGALGRAGGAGRAGLAVVDRRFHGVACLPAAAGRRA